MDPTRAAELAVQSVPDSNKALFIVLFFIVVLLAGGAAYLVKWILSQNQKQLETARAEYREDKKELMGHNQALLGGFQVVKDELRSFASTMSAAITGIDHRLGNVEDEVKEIREKVGS
jgi:flagellar basal body-associated protein FliL